MKRIFYPYNQWEDYKNGMYSIGKVFNEDALINKAIKLFSNEQELEKIMTLVTINWTKSTEVNLSNIEQNRRAWLGQAACCYKHKVPEDITRIAWNSLDRNIQDEANKTAENIIYNWEREKCQKYQLEWTF